MLAPLIGLLLGAADPAGLARYQADNRAVIAAGIRPRVVFMGDSITEGWARWGPALFGPRVLDRGISGQTTAEMLARFEQDVISLRPRAVHLMGGTNDIAGNGGAVDDAAILANLSAMMALAERHGIAVILAAIPPAAAFPWQPTARPAARIRRLNHMFRRLAEERGAGWVDYAAVLSDGRGGIPPALAADGVHPGAAGYARMRPLAEAAIARATR